MTTKEIWKYTLAVRSSQVLQMPEGAVILSAANQYDKLCIWALVDPDAKKVGRRIQILGTGNPFECPGDNETFSFVGTVVGNPFVWHVFDRGEDKTEE